MSKTSADSAAPRQMPTTMTMRFSSIIGAASPRDIPPELRALVRQKLEEREARLAAKRRK